MKRRKCVHIDRKNRLVRKVMVLEDINSTLDRFYICYCFKCKHVLFISFSHIDDRWQETESSPTFEKDTIQKHETKITGIEYTSIW
jgi:hypothetical protein